MFWTGEVLPPKEYSGQWLVTVPLSFHLGGPRSASAGLLTLACCPSEKAAKTLCALLSSNVDACRPLVEEMLSAKTDKF